MSEIMGSWTPIKDTFEPQLSNKTAAENRANPIPIETAEDALARMATEKERLKNELPYVEDEFGVNPDEITQSDYEDLEVGNPFPELESYLRSTWYMPIIDWVTQATYNWIQLWRNTFKNAELKIELSFYIDWSIENASVNDNTVYIHDMIEENTHMSNSWEVEVYVYNNILKYRST